MALYTRILGSLGIIVGFLFTACQPESGDLAVLEPSQVSMVRVDTSANKATPFPTRPMYQPGELVDYTAQMGDNLPALAVHFNTSEAEIRAANPFIPSRVTTLPPGMPMKIPVYYAPFWGSPFKILPDNLFINGPAQVGFDAKKLLAQWPGWLGSYSEYAAGENRSGGEIVDLVALNFSLSPKLLLALVEYQAGGLTQVISTAKEADYLLGNPDPKRRGLYLQLIWAANVLNNGYYGWRQGNLITFDLLDGRVERPDPWQNAASIALQYYFSIFLEPEAYTQAVGPDGLAAVYRALFGESWQNASPHLPGSLEQPELALPFKVGSTWAFTGGPHTAWGNGEPFAALDFAPGLESGGCTPTDEMALAAAGGIVARSEPGTVMLDLDGDGDERTGWVLFYFHLASEGRAVSGSILQAGDPVGHPSCEGGRATGTHVHIARKYNGEWIPAGGVLAFNLDGWMAAFGSAPYLGSLTRFSSKVTACTCSDANSHIQAGEK